ncbi:YqjK-like family protein [Vreelandella aquamarina]
MPTPNTSVKKSPELAPDLSRSERKQALLQTLEQQRIDIMVDGLRLQRAAAPIDATWQKAMRFRKPLLLLGGVLAWRFARHPGRLASLGKKALAGYAVAKKLRHFTN